MQPKCSIFTNLATFRPVGGAILCKLRDHDR